MKKIIMIKDGKIETYQFSIENLKLCTSIINPNNERSYICFDCENARPDKCQKIFDKRKKITRYSFIKNGYHVTGTNNLAVYDCNNFSEDK